MINIRSLIIKDIEMPQNCDVCRWSDWSNLHQTVSCQLRDYEVGFADYSREFEHRRADFCPIIETDESCEINTKPISYQDCANAMLMMWMDDVVTDGEYNRIMDKLNAHYKNKKEVME